MEPDPLMIHVTVAYAPEARKVCEITLELPTGATLEQALQASGIGQRFPGLDLDAATVGVWGRKVKHGHILRDQDRMEIYRPLRVDPKVARRERYAKQGAGTAGLFAKRRAGAKAGY